MREVRTYIPSLDLTPSPALHDLQAELIQALPENLQLHMLTYFASDSFAKRLQRVEKSISSLSDQNGMLAGSMFEDITEFYAPSVALKPGEKLLKGETMSDMYKLTQTQSNGKHRLHRCPDALILFPQPEEDRTLIVGAMEVTTGKMEERKRSQIEYFANGDIVRHLLYSRTVPQREEIEARVQADFPDIPSRLEYDPKQFKLHYFRPALHENKLEQSNFTLYDVPLPKKKLLRFTSSVLRSRNVYPSKETTFVAD